jgi:hypothetical protein
MHAIKPFGGFEEMRIVSAVEEAVALRKHPEQQGVVRRLCKPCRDKNCCL